MSDIPVRHASKPYEVAAGVDRFDFERVHGWLTKSYWSPGIPRALVEKGFGHSLAFGLYHDTDGQVGCARMITDQATFAYLADVFIDPGHRGHGLGLWMMKEIMAYPALQGLRRLMLATRDMHSLYEKVGFKPVALPDRLMEITVPDIYRRKAD